LPTDSNEAWAWPSRVKEGSAPTTRHAPRIRNPSGRGLKSHGGIAAPKLQRLCTLRRRIAPHSGNPIRSLSETSTPQAGRHRTSAHDHLLSPTCFVMLTEPVGRFTPPEHRAIRLTRSVEQATLTYYTRWCARTRIDRAELS
jgi:hypothetical protein